jgi:hypothetical protein
MDSAYETKGVGFRAAASRMTTILALGTTALLVLVGTARAQGDPFAQLDPREMPSAAGERVLLERAGVLPPEPAPGDEPAIGSLQSEALALPALLSHGGPGSDVQVNDGADAGDRTTQSETTLAVLGDTVCAGYNDFGVGGASGLSRSIDSGETWNDLGGIGQRGDPVLAVHEATGDFYYAEIATIGGNPAIGVARSTDDCQGFAAPVDAAPNSSGLAGTMLSDKPWIAIDNTGGANDGNIYVCWTRFIDTDGDGQANTSELRFSRSINAGASFQNEQIIVPTGTAPFGCSVGVGPMGEVYVAWADRTGATQDDIRFRSSMTAGVGFNAAVPIATGNRHPGIDRVINCNPNGNNRPSLNGNIRMLHQAWLAVDTTGGAFDGNIYVAWASDPVGTIDNSDVFFSVSSNQGVNWSPVPIQLGTGVGATDQFEPHLAVGGPGDVSLAWYDRRNDADNNLNIDVYKTFTRDGGTTFDPLVRVTDQSFGVPQLNPNFDPGVANCYMGEYIAVAGDDTRFYYAWGDNRNTVTNTNWPNGRPDPDVFFDSQPAPSAPVIHVVKLVDDEPDGVFDDDPSGWTFEVLDAVGLVDEEVTDGTGLLAFVVPADETYTVQETVGPAGLWSVDASCVDDDTGGPVGSGVTGAEFASPDAVGVTDLALSAGQSVTCTFENQRMAGFVTGGGNIRIGSGSQGPFISFGGNAGVALDGQPHGQWQTVFHDVGNPNLVRRHFHGDAIETILFGNDPTEEPPDPPPAPFNEVHFVASGRLDGQTCQLRVDATDHGEPASGKKAGLDSDSIRFRLDCPGMAFDYDSASDFPEEEAPLLHHLDGGNLQIHPPSRENDFDGDWLVNAIDNCSEAYNPRQIDTNGDGYGNVCDADYDDDAVVGAKDYMALARAFGSRRGEPAYDPEIDCNGDGVIGASEAILFGRSWGGAPGPSGLVCEGACR